MPSVSLSSGELAELVTLNRFDAVSINPDGADVRVGKHRSYARQAELTKDQDRTIKVALHDNETIYVYAEGSVTVNYRMQGFLDWIQPREQVDTDITAQSIGNIDTNLNSVGVTNVPVDIDAQTVGNIGTSIDNVGVTNLPIDITAQTVGNIGMSIDAVGVTNVPTSIDAATATIDQNITGSDIDVPTSIDAQTVTIDENTKRVGASSVTEVNADQTASIGTNSTQTTTVTADVGEIWKLTGFDFNWDADSSWDGSTGDRVNFTVQKELQGVEIGFARSNDNHDDNRGALSYKSGAWRGSFSTTRDDIIGHTIDDTNGVEVVVENESPDHSMDNTRRIRFEFEVTQV